MKKRGLVRFGRSGGLCENGSAGGLRGRVGVVTLQLTGKKPKGVSEQSRKGNNEPGQSGQTGGFRQTGGVRSGLIAVNVFKTDLKKGRTHWLGKGGRNGSTSRFQRALFLFSVP